MGETQSLVGRDEPSAGSAPSAAEAGPKAPVARLGAAASPSRGAGSRVLSSRSTDRCLTRTSNRYPGRGPSNTEVDNACE